MRERAEMIGGRFLLEAVPDQGTVIRISIPPPPAKPASQAPLNNHHDETNLSPHC
jgi:signal transduction histidine kinase